MAYLCATIRRNYIIITIFSIKLTAKYCLLGSLEAWSQKVKEPPIFSVCISSDLQKTLPLLTWALLKSRGTKKIVSHINSFLSCLQKKGFSWKERHTGIKHTTTLIKHIRHIAVGCNSKVINNLKLTWPLNFAKMSVSMVW